jgi:hypothetical protein
LRCQKFFFYHDDKMKTCNVRLAKVRKAFLLCVFYAAMTGRANADLAHVDYVHGAVQSVVSQINQLLETGYIRAEEKSAPGGVASLDGSGRIPTAQLPIGTTPNTVAAGNDSRFHSIPTSMPSGTPPPGHVFIWFEP